MLFWIRMLKILAIIFAPKKTKDVWNLFFHLIFARFAMQFQFLLCLPMQTKITQRNQGRNPTYFLHSFLLLWPLKAKMKIESDIATSTLSFLIKSFLCNWIILPAISCIFSFPKYRYVRLYKKGVSDMISLFLLILHFCLLSSQDELCTTYYHFNLEFL